MAETVANQIRRAAMDLLARREHSFQELDQKLSRRFPDQSEQIAGALGKLQAQGLQSDERMAEAFIRARMNRGQGPIKISAELRIRGLADQIISQALDEAGVDWFAQARQVCERKFGVLEPRDLKDKAKRARFLQQRGFSFDQIGTLLN